MDGDSGLRTHLGYWLRRLSDDVHLRFERQLAERGVSVAQWNVLVTLYRGEGRTVGEVADFIETDVAAVSRLVARLVDKGLVVRSPDPSSRRRTLLTLTTAAQEMLPDLIAIADANDEAFFGSMPTGQRAELSDLLQRLLPTAQTQKRSTPGERQ